MTVYYSDLFSEGTFVLQRCATAKNDVSYLFPSIQEAEGLSYKTSRARAACWTFSQLNEWNLFGGMISLNQEIMRFFS